MRSLFTKLTGYKPFPWQCEVYNHFCRGEVPSFIDIPVGLGKTSIVTIWLIALANYPDMVSRRLVYVVNRRTVVDQTTAEVEKLRVALDSKLELAELRAQLESLCAIPLGTSSPLAISTLRGQFADNREWHADPARPAVIIGTVDMVGSGLVFSRYAVGFKSRPHHAAFLAQDALLVHDEAHLEPAFQKLLDSIASEQSRTNDPRKLRVVALTATQRGNGAAQLTLTDADRRNSIVNQRINACKKLRLVPVVNVKDGNDKASDSDVRKEIIKRALAAKSSNRAVLIFVRSVAAAKTIAAELDKKKCAVATLTGTMRGKERDELATRNPVFQRFLPPSSRAEGVDAATGTAYLVATSAGEVGINISADDLICDLSTYESMAQRLGRLNRFGELDDSNVDVVHRANLQAEFYKILSKELEKSKGKNASQKNSSAIAEEGENENNATSKKLVGLKPLIKTLEILKELDGNASPNALSGIAAEKRAEAFSPQPKMREATAMQFDAWAMTSIQKPLAARQPVEPYLHGEAEWESPETFVAWRDEVDVLSANASSGLADDNKPQDLLEDYPLKPHELLRDTSERVCDWLFALLEKCKATASKQAWLINETGGVETLNLANFFRDDNYDGADTIESNENEDDANDDTEDEENGGAETKKKANKKQRQRVITRISNAKLVLSPSLGGLSGKGILDAAAGTASDVSETPHRKRIWSDMPEYDNADNFDLIRVIDTRFAEDDDDGNETGIETDDENTGFAKPRARYWLWLADKTAASEEKRRSVKPERLSNHHSQTAAHAHAIATKLLAGQPRLARCIILAAQSHDLGKNRRMWQLGIGNAAYDPAVPDSIFARPGGAMRPRNLVEHYRHEFGSLNDIALPADLADIERDLILHLIAAHHGRARPHFSFDESFDCAAAPGASEVIAAEVPNRFARLQQCFGRWGLAWLESFLRSADYAASAGVEAKTPPDNTYEQSTAAPMLVDSLDSAAKSRTDSDTITLYLSPANPGHYFACCGLFELAARLAPNTVAWFSGDGAVFHIAAPNITLRGLLEKLAAAEITMLDADDATASPLFIEQPFALRLDWWKTATQKTTALKTWAGSMEVPRIAKAMQSAVKEAISIVGFDFSQILFDARITYYPDSPQKKAEPFCFDANRGPNADSRDVGFSPNDLKLKTIAAPAAELLCLIGLQRAVPKPSGRPRVFDYNLWTTPILISILPAAVNGLLPNSITHGFRFESWFRTSQRKHKAFLSAKSI